MFQEPQIALGIFFVRINNLILYIENWNKYFTSYLFETFHINSAMHRFIFLCFYVYFPLDWEYWLYQTSSHCCFDSEWETLIFWIIGTISSHQTIQRYCTSCWWRWQISNMVANKGLYCRRLWFLKFLTIWWSLVTILIIIIDKNARPVSFLLPRR